MVHFVKRLGKVKVNDIVVIAIQKTLDDVVNVLEEMSEAAATFTFAGVLDPNCPPVPAVQPRLYLVHFCPIMPNQLNMPKTQFFSEFSPANFRIFSLNFLRPHPKITVAS